MVVSSVPLTEVCPVESRKDSQGGERSAVTAFAMEDAEAVGLIKIDVLGLKTVSVIKDALEMIRKRYGKDVEALSLGLDDHKVYENFNNINTVGIFQTDAAAYRNLIERMGIDNFNDLVVSNALVRPGALLSQGQRYIDCKKGEANPKYAHEVVQSILEETYGTVIFQEQLMQMAVLLADFTWSERLSVKSVMLPNLISLKTSLLTINILLRRNPKRFGQNLNFQRCICLINPTLLLTHLCLIKQCG
jgi:DNA polymerase-3 subunit alpha